MSSVRSSRTSRAAWSAAPDRRVLPVAAVGGALLVLLADVAARFVRPGSMRAPGAQGR